MTTVRFLRSTSVQGRRYRRGETARIDDALAGPLEHFGNVEVRATTFPTPEQVDILARLNRLEAGGALGAAGPAGARGEVPAGPSAAAWPVAGHRTLSTAAGSTAPERRG